MKIETLFIKIKLINLFQKRNFQLCLINNKYLKNMFSYIK
jgi:hypothetical protein